MTKKCLLVALLSLWPLAGMAENQAQLVERYTALAGSKENATSLVTGLRDGKDVTLKKGTTTSETFTPPTGKMGYGNVDNALALTRASLQKQGIAEATPEQLKSALMGVLQQRADGKGWGVIAHSMGFKLGELKRSERAQPERRSANADSRRADRAERVARADRPDRPARPERPDKPERPQR